MTVGWETVVMVQPDLAAAQQLCTFLAGFKARSGLSYEKLAELASCSRGTAENYIAKPGHSRGEDILNSLLTALGVTDAERAEALLLHRRSRPETTDPVTVGWRVAAAEADCTVWEMDEFTPAEATVHPAIRRGRVLVSDGNPVMSPPAYVQRDHDTSLRADVAAAARGELRALVVLRGGPSTGKTRSLFEAVHALGPGWAVIRPRSATAVRGLVTSGLLHRRRCVLWLNELQTFLGPNGAGLSLDVLRDLFAATGNRTDGTNRSPQPLVMVATLWPEKLRDATAPADHFSDNRGLLAAANEWVRWHDVLRDFSRRERGRARKLAASTGDERLGAALANRDRIGFAQTLAGAHELLQHYLTAPNHMDQLLLDAACDARRLGHTSPITAPLLRATATALWRDERGQTSQPPDWFDTAIAHATQPLRSTQGVQALIPLDCTDPHDTTGKPGTYELADYLEQHLSQTRHTHPVSDAVWNALRDHSAAPDDLCNLAKAARNRGRFQHGEALYRAAGTPGALGELTSWLAVRPGHEQEAERVYRDAIASGHPHVLSAFVRWLTGQPGREAEAEEAFRDAVAAGDGGVLHAFARWLTGQPGREAEAEEAFRDAVAAGDRGVLYAFARWLTGQPGREAEAEEAFRDAIAAGDFNALQEFAARLTEQPGREAEAELLFRDAIADGRSFVLHMWISRLVAEPGRKAVVERVYQNAIAAGDYRAVRVWADWLATQPGREAEVERVYRDTIIRYPDGLSSFAGWLATQPGREAEAEQVYRDAIVAGDSFAFNLLANWLATQPGREPDTERALRDAISADEHFAHVELADWLAIQPGREAEVEQAYEDAIAAGDRNAFRGWIDWLAIQPGREAEVEQAYEDAIAAGDRNAFRGWIDWLATQPGREAEVEQAYEDAIAAGDLYAFYSLIDWLREQPGREAEVEQVYRDAVTAGDPSAFTKLTDWLAEQPSREREAKHITRFGLD
ncbi:hypothetical protein [Amycolatopsis sp. cmx-11-12]|uniref:hypothetical protein n=1 Tax=Amycolatopsis sp. cmx-11-12 TaxID=2785795 RepID=UPI003918090C